MKAKKGRKWTTRQRQAARDRWTFEMKGEARFRTLVRRYRDLLRKVLTNPEARQKLVELARG